MKVYKNELPDYIKERQAIDDRVAALLPPETPQGEWHTLPIDYEGELVSWRGENVMSYSRAIQSALDAYGNIDIPYSDSPLYLTRPIVMKSGCALRVHPKTRLVLIGDSCILVNQSIADGHDRPASRGEGGDQGIRVSGGIWESPDVRRVDTGAFRDYRGCDSSVCLSNVKGVRLSDMTIKIPCAWAFSLATASVLPLSASILRTPCATAFISTAPPRTG